MNVNHTVSKIKDQDGFSIIKANEKVEYVSWMKFECSWILLLYKILSDCHFVDEINDLLNAFRWKKKVLEKISSFAISSHFW